MLSVENTQHYLWHNSIAERPVLVGTVLLGEAFARRSEDWPPALRALLDTEFPSALAKMPGDVPELLAAIVQQLQLRGDIVVAQHGVISRDAERRGATIYFSCMDAHLGASILHHAVKLVDLLTRPASTQAQLRSALKTAGAFAAASGLYVTTRRMVVAAEERKIPWCRFNRFTRHAQLGHGASQHRVMDTIADVESYVGWELAKNKLATLELLSRLALPVGRFASIRDNRSALRAAETVGYPLVLKLGDSGKGESVFTDLRDASELRDVLARVRVDQRRFMLQSFFSGDDYRFLVVSGKLVAAARRVPASVTGDGTANIKELVRRANESRHPSLSPIVLDGETDRILARSGHTRDNVPKQGEWVRIRGTANISTGGSAVDVMDIVHPDNVSLAIRAAAAVGVKVAGVDVICTDISRSWREMPCGICEVNTSPGLRMHVVSDPKSNVPARILDVMYPGTADGRIPTAIAMGPGATMVTTILTAILAVAGHVVGCANAAGTMVGHEQVARGDQTTHDGASLVLRDPTVTAAVMEAERDDVGERGLCLDMCDVMIVLGDGDASEHRFLGAARKATVLDADDPHLPDLIAAAPPGVRAVLFARSNSPTLRDHTARGGEALWFEGTCVMTSARSTLAALPSTLDKCRREALAASSAALALELEPSAIARGLAEYASRLSA